MQLTLLPRRLPVSLALRFGNKVTSNVFEVDDSDIDIVFDVPRTAETPQGSEILIAATDIGGHRVVIQDVGGVCRYADIENVLHSGKVVGITASASVQGSPITINNSGVVTEVSWNWNAGEDVWLGSNAMPTQTIPANGAFLQRLGYAISTNSMRITIDDSVILGE